MRNCGDDADLRIGPAHAFDPSALPDLRALPVGSHEKARFDLTALHELRRYGEWSRCEVRDQVRRDNIDRLFFSHSGRKYAIKRTGLYDVGGCFASIELIVEAEKMRSEIGLEWTVGNLDRRDGLRGRRKRIPQPEHCEEAPGCRGEREAARILSSAGLSGWSFGVHERDAEAPRRLLGQNQRKRLSGESAAGNRDIEKAAL
jgi:hypothetical protein